MDQTKDDPRIAEVTNWHQLFDDEIDAELAKLNGQLRQRGLRSRFKVVLDDVELEWYVILDDEADQEIVETIEEAEEIVEELCEHRCGDEC